jgi:hypothetical protein
LKPKDSLLIHLGESLSHFIFDDFFIKHYFNAAKSTENTDKNVEEAILIQMPIHLELLAKNMLDTKFICGDQITIYDFNIGGLFTNLILNHKSKYSAYFQKAWLSAPEKVK